jgi:hypothetical protein
MTAQKPSLFLSPLAQAPRASSPPLSAAHPPPSGGDSPTRHPTTSSTLSSSQTFSFTQTSESCDEPDYFEEFTYSSDMEEDFRRIDTEAAVILGTQAAQPAQENLQPAQANPQPPAGGGGVHPPYPGRGRPERRWVVFHGRNPGIYENK